MPRRKTSTNAPMKELKPLHENMQLGVRVYNLLKEQIVTGRITQGSPMRPDTIAKQLNVSTTPVREAIQRLELDGLTVKFPYQGWFVRVYNEPQIRELYEFRTTLERMGIRLACQNVTKADVKWLLENQVVGRSAIKAHDLEQYNIYNRDFHSAILRIAKNSYLISAMDQVTHQCEMFAVKSEQIEGRPPRAVEEHEELIKLLEAGKQKQAEELMQSHILSALEDILRINFIASESAHPAPAIVLGLT